MRVAVVGAGPQAVGHVSTLAAVHPLHDARYLVRDPSRTPLHAIALGSAEADQTLRSADVVVCATSARSPVFDSALLRDEAVVIAVGSHEPDARELDAALLGRAGVVVEDVRTAVRGAGDVVLAIADGTLEPASLLTMRDVVTGAIEVPDDRPLVFKSVGMSWQDRVVATAVLQHISGRSPSIGRRPYYRDVASRSHFTPDEARAAGERVGVDWASAPFDLEQFRMGMDVELEHGTRDPQTNLTDDDAVMTAKIARAHLNEFPDYYTRLARMEAEAEGRPKGTDQGE